MTDRARYAQVEDQIRHQMNLVIAVSRPYTQSNDHFNDWDDVREAIRSAAHALESADLAANHRLPPRR